MCIGWEIGEKGEQERKNSLKCILHTLCSVHTLNNVYTVTNLIDLCVQSALHQIKLKMPFHFGHSRKLYLNWIYVLLKVENGKQCKKPNKYMWKY